MNIAILGAGAMGGVFGYKLYEAGHQVTLIDNRPEAVQAINGRGLMVEGLGGGRAFPVKAVERPALATGPVDLLLVLVKAYDTEQAVRSARNLLNPETVVLSLQNGLGNLERLAAAVGREPLIGGVTGQGAYQLGPGRIFHAGDGYVALGELDGRLSPRVERLAQALEGAAFSPVVISENIQALIWKKLLSNVAVNAITALTGIRNGQILEFPQALEIAQQAVMEAAGVAKAKGVFLPEDPWEGPCQVIKATAANRSSMLQDVEAGRRTEVDMINGAIAREGQALGLPTPVNKTLAALVTVIQQTYKKPREALGEEP